MVVLRRPYYGDLDALALCPMATRWEVNKKRAQLAGHLARWRHLGQQVHRLEKSMWKGTQNTFVSASYGWNDWVALTYCGAGSTVSGLPRRRPPCRFCWMMSFQVAMGVRLTSHPLTTGTSPRGHMTVSS